jgi:hypothetical protein
VNTNGVKADNHAHALTAKLDIRRRVLEQVGPGRAVVFDAFAGAGVMWSHVWKNAAGYVGVDEREWFRDERCCFVADNRRVLRAIDLQPFTVFDLDAYGSPWEQALIIAARRRVAKGERLGLIITEGTSLHTRFSSLPHALRQAAGLNPAVADGAGRLHDELIARALLGVVKRLRCAVVRQWRAANTTGAQVRYIGSVIEGVGR